MSYPRGLKPGDFIQTDSHFGDIFFEVIDCWKSGNYWHVVYTSYAKYSGVMEENWVNSASNIRKHVKAKGAVDYFVKNNLRYQSTKGQYDPFYGFAPVGTPLRNRGE